MKYNNVAIIGAAGFIGTNLAMALQSKKFIQIKLVDEKEVYFDEIRKLNIKNVKYCVSKFKESTDFSKIVSGQDIVFHLASTSMPTNSNEYIPTELRSNVITTSMLLEACVKNGVKKVVFISSGGQVYGQCQSLPIKETQETFPITSYGIQKLTIEKLLFLYEYLYGLDYSILRVANPFGPHQRPNGKLGVVTTFVYSALNGKELVIYGDGNVVRDFIYIDDAVEGICNVAFNDGVHKIYNIGSGKGTSVNELIGIIEDALGKKLRVRYIDGRKNDVPINYLDVSRYESEYGKLCKCDLREGIRKTADFLRGFNFDEACRK